MARTSGKLVYTIPRWREQIAKCVIWPISVAYAIGLVSDNLLDRIIEKLTRFAVGNIRKNSRIEWE